MYYCLLAFRPFNLNVGYGDSMENINIAVVDDLLRQQQEKFISAIFMRDETISCNDDIWTDDKGGNGRTVVFCDGDVFEKVAVNFSNIKGDNLPPAATNKRPDLKGHSFNAVGLSIVSHPKNPFVPTSHENLRFFSTTSSENPQWWFGGGFDLTPYVGFKSDAVEWHRAAYNACCCIGEEYYLTFKDLCDHYFFIKHRKEHRGIGGLFFDDFNDFEFERCLEFVKAVGEEFLSSYMKILDRRQDHSFSKDDILFKNYRRGRYAEFNLVLDRGTLFGLQFGGRIESILASLPPIVHWPHSISQEFKFREANLLTDYLTPKDWLNLNPKTISE